MRRDMTIEVRVDPVHHIRYAAASGVLTDADVLDGYGAVLTDPGRTPGR